MATVIEPALLNPFPGLRPFGEDEAYLFFGREEHVDELLEKLRGHRFVAVLGTSGSGKSSLVLAGLLPALDGGFRTAAGPRWRVARMRPGNDPFGNLARALRGAEADEIELGITEATLKRSHLGLIQAVRESRLAPGENLLVLVDQFEELFRYRRLAGPAAADPTVAFVRLLLEASAQEELPIRVLLTMRSEFLGECTQIPGLPEAINDGQYLIPRLNRRQREAVITGPAGVAGASISPPLLQRLLNDVGDNPDQLPILQHALMRTFELWRRRGRLDEPLSLADYEAAGTMSKALSQHAEEVLAELAGQQRALVEVLFRCLTEKSAEGFGIRRPAALGEVAAIAGVSVEEVLAVVQHFRTGDRTFLVLPANAAATAATLVDISHESLMRIWDRLARWTGDEAQAAERYRRLARSAQSYFDQESGLWRDPELELALRWWKELHPNAAWARRYGLPYEPVVDFLARSRAEREAEKDREEKARERETEREAALQRADAEKKAARRLLVAVIAVSIALVASILSGFLARQQASLARAQARRAREAEISSHVTSANFRTVTGDRLTALGEALTAGREIGAGGGSPALRRSVESALLSALSGIAEKTHWDGRTTSPAALLYDHRRRLVSAGYDQVIRIWDSQGRLEKKLFGHNSAVSALAVSPVDDWIVSGDETGNLFFWDQNGLVANRGDPRGRIKALAFAPDGRTVASISGNGGLILWELARVQETGYRGGVRIDDPAIESVRFHPKGNLMATGRSDGTIGLWRTGDLLPLNILREQHKGSVVSLDFSSDGRFLASADAEGTIRIWSVGSWLLKDRPAGPLRQPGAAVRFLSASLDLASAGPDEVVRIWSEEGGMTELRGPQEPVAGLDVDPHGETLATISRSGSIDVWSLENLHRTLKQVLTRQVLAIAVSPDGQQIASGSDDGTVGLWSLDGKWRGGQAGCAPTRVTSVKLSPGGSMLAAGCSGGDVVLWPIIAPDAGLGKPVRFQADDQGVNEVDFSPDGKTLLSAGQSGTLRFWPVGAGKEMRPENSLSLDDARIRILGARLDPAGSGDVLWTGFDQQTGHIGLIESGVSRLLMPGGRQGSVVRGAFSRDGRWIATASATGETILWRRGSPLLYRLQGPRSGVNEVAFSPDGNLLALAGQDGRIQVWRTDTRALHRTLIGHTAGVTSLVFSPPGDVLVSGSYDGTVRIWRDLSLPLDQLMAKGREWIRDYRFRNAGVSR